MLVNGPSARQTKRLVPKPARTVVEGLSFPASAVAQGNSICRRDYDEVEGILRRSKKLIDVIVLEILRELYGNTVLFYETTDTSSPLFLFFLFFFSLFFVWGITVAILRELGANMFH